MGIPATHLVLRFYGRVARSSDTLEECGLRPSRRIVEGNVVVDPTQTGGEYRMPSVLVVSIVNGESAADGPRGVVRDDWLIGSQMRLESWNERC